MNCPIWCCDDPEWESLNAEKYAFELLILFPQANKGSGLSPPKGNFVGVIRDTHHRI